MSPGHPPAAGWFPVDRGPARRRGRHALLVTAGLVIGTLLSGVTLLAATDDVEEPLVASRAAAQNPGPAANAPSDAAPSDAAPSEPCEPWPVEQRAAAVLVVGLPGVTDADDELAGEVLGLGVGGVFLSRANVVDAAQVRRLVRGLRARSDLPLLVATDEEAGRVSSFARVLGRTSSPRTLAGRLSVGGLRAFAGELGTVLARAGVDLAFAPVADLDDGPARGVIGDRSFSAEPRTAATAARAFARGLADARVMATAKHFPGHGRSAVDSHRRLGTVDASLDELVGEDLVPFRALIEDGVPVVMTGHVAYEALGDDLPASLSPAAYRLLRDLGFRGVAITDSLGMGAVHASWGFGEAAVLAVTAGADAAMATDGRWALEMRDALAAAVGDGTLPESRLNEAAARMLWLRGVDPWPATCTELDLPSGPLAPAGG